MSKSAKVSPSSTETTVPFEEALHKLESIVETMETGDLPLEQLLSKFEEGARLARTCQVQLAAAEVRVRLLEKSISGELTTRPVELAAEDDAASS